MSMTIRIDGEIPNFPDPLQLEVANINMYRIIDAYGLSFYDGNRGFCRTCYATSIINPINRNGKDELIEELTSSDISDNLIFKGITREQATEYVETLARIATEALRRGKDIVW